MSEFYGELRLKVVMFSEGMVYDPDWCFHVLQLTENVEIIFYGGKPIGCYDQHKGLLLSQDLKERYSDEELADNFLLIADQDAWRYVVKLWGEKDKSDIKYYPQTHFDHIVDDEIKSSRTYELGYEDCKREMEDSHAYREGVRLDY